MWCSKADTASDHTDTLGDFCKCLSDIQGHYLNSKWQGLHALLTALLTSPVYNPLIPPLMLHIQQMEFFVKGRTCFGDEVSGVGWSIDRFEHEAAGQILQLRRCQRWVMQAHHQFPHETHSARSHQEKVSILFFEQNNWYLTANGKNSLWTVWLQPFVVICYKAEPC